MIFMFLLFIYLFFLSHLILCTDNQELYHFLLLMYIYYYHRERIEIVMIFIGSIEGNKELEQQRNYNAKYNGYQDSS